MDGYRHRRARDAGPVVPAVARAAESSAGQRKAAGHGRR